MGKSERRDLSIEDKSKFPGPGNYVIKGFADTLLENQTKKSKNDSKKPQLPEINRNSQHSSIQIAIEEN